MRGRSVADPGSNLVRPTGSKVRQALFNILCSQVSGCRFLDLFAGSGIVGFEAASRYAASVVFIEENPRLVRRIGLNLEKLGLTAQVIAGDVRLAIPELTGRLFDIVFADPPYESRLPLSTLALVDRHEVLASRGTLVIEHATHLLMPERKGKLRRAGFRRYGQTALSFYRSRE